jgi:2-polyprenyl-6-methoxyphenol hydroxylase-like FAD-dependent oxidoreductase
MESYDVVIVGYGPTGCMLALKLGRCGRRVLVLERQEAGYPLPRAAHLDDEVCRTFQGVGIPPTALPDVIEPPAGRKPAGPRRTWRHSGRGC